MIEILFWLCDINFLYASYNVSRVQFFEGLVKWYFIHLTGPLLLLLHYQAGQACPRPKGLDVTEVGHPLDLADLVVIHLFLPVDVHDIRHSIKVRTMPNKSPTHNHGGSGVVKVERGTRALRRFCSASDYGTLWIHLLKLDSLIGKPVQVGCQDSASRMLGSIVVAKVIVSCVIY